MKIVHLIFSLNTGGAETMLVDIMNQQVMLGHHVSLIVINNSYSNEILSGIDAKVSIVLIKRPPSSLNPWYILRLNWSLFRIKPDVIHLHNASIENLLFTTYAGFLTIHALETTLYPSNARLSELFAISDAVKEDVEKRYPGKYCIQVIPNGIRLNDIQRRNNNNVLRDGIMRIVQVARLNVAIKGQDLLIDAINILKQRGIASINVDFIGTGSDEVMLKEKVTKYAMNDHVRFLGLRNRDYIYSHLKDYDLMCHPSRYEGFGLTVAEGIAAGLPVLVPDADGPYEIIQQGKLGYTFKKGDAYSLADSLQDIYEHYHERITSVVDIAYLHVKQNYSIESMVAQYIQEYNRFLK